MTGRGGRRRTVRGALLLAVLGWSLCAWTVVQGTREIWRSYRYRVADPWPAEAPVQWTVTSRHVTALRDRLRALGLPEVADDGVLAVSPPEHLGDQGWYHYQWVAYLLPAVDVRFADEPREVASSDLWLAFGRPLHPHHEQLAGRPGEDRAVLYRVSQGPVSQGPVSQGPVSSEPALERAP